MDAKYKKYFKAHPKVDKFYFTSDGLAFTNADEANNHQATIKGNKVAVVTQCRKDIEPAKTDEPRENKTPKTK